MELSASGCFLDAQTADQAEDRFDSFRHSTRADAKGKKACVRNG